MSQNSAGNEFDLKAKTWDDNPEHVKRSKMIADAIRKEVPFDPSFTAMEYGCGTGLISLSLRDHFSKITLVDSSQGMLDVLNGKIKDAGISNMESLNIDLLHTEDVHPGPFSVIYNSLVLHHVDDVERMFRVWYTLLKSGGYLCVVDLDSEKGLFHGENFTGHNGFDRNWLEELAGKEGFLNFKFKTVGEIRKLARDGVERSFPLFLMVCRKS